MSDRIYEIFFFDIYVAILKIKFVSSKFKSSDDLLNDFVSWDSVIREFEIIGEATKILLQQNLIDKEYKVIVDFRNKIIHHYFGVDAEAVWDIIENDINNYETYIINKIKLICLIKFYIQQSKIIKNIMKYQKN